MSRLTCLRFFLPAAAFAALSANAQPARPALAAPQTERRADGSPELIRYERAAAPAAADAPAALRAAYGLGQQSELRPRGAAETDALGYSHQKYQQYYQGVPVEFTATVAHSRGGAVEFVTGETRAIADGALRVANLPLTIADATATLHLTTLAPGLYSVRVRGAEGAATARFVKE